jgi:hypothetical protein
MQGFKVRLPVPVAEWVAAHPDETYCDGEDVES